MDRIDIIPNYTIIFCCQRQTAVSINIWSDTLVNKKTLSKDTVRVKNNEPRFVFSTRGVSIKRYILTNNIEVVSCVCVRGIVCVCVSVYRVFGCTIITIRERVTPEYRLYICAPKMYDLWKVQY